MMIRGSSSKQGEEEGDERKAWVRLKDPRIVRVSRAFGGKDRHSKVCTVRGLRDRRVRLSVPTAIQLYDLQHRLGLTQPSKVVDWLLNAAKDEIDHLPPLQMPPNVDWKSKEHLQVAKQNSETNMSLLNNESLYQWEANSYPVSHEVGLPSTLSLASGSQPYNMALQMQMLHNSSFYSIRPDHFPSK